MWKTESNAVCSAKQCRLFLTSCQVKETDYQAEYLGNFFILH